MVNRKPLDLFVKSNVREYIISHGFYISGELLNGAALNNVIVNTLDKAIDHAKANGRNTVLEKDLLDKKGETTEVIFVKSKVREYIKSRGFNTSAEIIDGTALSNVIVGILDKAMNHAKSDGRIKILEKDLFD